MLCSECMIVIICFGAGLEHRPNAKEPFEWIGSHTAKRATAAATLWQQEQDSLLIFSGGRTAGAQYPSEAEAMREYVCRAPWNIPAAHILTESESTDTAENVRNVVTLLREKHLPTDHLILVAGRKNVQRATTYFRAYGLHVTPRSAADILGENPEEITTADRVREAGLRLLQHLDRKGSLATRYVHWQRKH